MDFFDFADVEIELLPKIQNSQQHEQARKQGSAGVWSRSFHRFAAEFHEHVLEFRRFDTRCLLQVPNHCRRHRRDQQAVHDRVARLLLPVVEFHASAFHQLIDAIIKFEPLQQLPAAPILSNRAK